MALRTFQNETPKSKIHIITEWVIKGICRQIEISKHIIIVQIQLWYV